MNSRGNISNIIQKVTFPLVLLFGLQLISGILLIVFFYNDSFYHEIKSLAIVILMAIISWYIWLIPFYTILWIGYRIYTLNKLHLVYFILFSLSFYLVYFTLIYRDNFWQLFCFSTNCSLSDWFKAEKQDLFFNVFTLFINIYFCVSLFKNENKNWVN